MVFRRSERGLVASQDIIQKEILVQQAYPFLLFSKMFLSVAEILSYMEKCFAEFHRIHRLQNIVLHTVPYRSPGIIKIMISAEYNNLRVS